MVILLALVLFTISYMYDILVRALLRARNAPFIDWSKLTATKINMKLAELN